MEKLEFVILCIALLSSPISATFNRRICVIVEGYEFCKKSGDLLSVERKNSSNNKLTLNINDQKISSIKSNALENLTIANLQLESISGTLELETGCFKGSSEIQSLQFMTGSSKNLKKVLTELRNLTELTIDDCRLTKIEDDTFLTGNISSQVTHLSVTNCKVDTIKPMAFLPFKNLQHLNLGKNKIRIIKNTTFYGLEKLKYLSMEGNELKSIDDNSFKELHQLETLVLIDNSLKNVDPGTFSGKNIVELILSDNDLTKLTLGMFNGLEKLKKLDLLNNKINSIEDGALNGLNLQELKLESNKLKILRKGNFQGLTVKMLDLSRNQMMKIEDGTFNGSVIETLYLLKSDVTYLNKIDCGLLKTTKVIY